MNSFQRQFVIARHAFRDRTEKYKNFRGSKTNNYHFHHCFQIPSHPVTKSFKSKSKAFSQQNCTDHFKEYNIYVDVLFEERNRNSRSTLLAETPEELLKITKETNQQNKPTKHPKNKTKIKPRLV